MDTTMNLPLFETRSLKELSVKFLAFMEKNRGRSKLTIKVYKTALSEALSLAIINEKLKTIDFMPFREAIADEKPKTIAKKISAVRSFLNYLESLGYRFYARSLNSVKVPKLLPKPVSHKHILETLNSIGGEYALLIEILYGLGLRINEARTLKIKDIGERFILVSGKGGKERQVPIMPALSRRVNEHIKNGGAKVFLFEKDGEPLSDNKIRYMVTKTFRENGLKVTPHQLRHAFATETLNGGAGIADVSEILGHARLETTEIYTKLSTSKKLKSYLESHPLCKGGN